MSADPTTVITEPTPEPTPTIAAPEPTPAPEPSGNWRDQHLPVDLRDNPTLANIANVEGVARELVNVQKLIGADKVVIPGKDATPEDWNTFHTKLGRPEKAEDYDLSGLEIPEDLPWDSDLQTSMVEKMHKLGMSQAMVQGVLSGYVEFTGSQFEQNAGDKARAREDAVKTLQKEWGNSYPAQKDRARRALVAGAEGDESILHLPMEDGLPLGSNPAVLKVFATLGKKMDEHGLIGPKTIVTTPTSKEAVAQRNKLMEDEVFMKAYMSDEHPEHAAAIQRIANLTDAKVGTE